MNQPSHNCDAQARAGMWIVGFMGTIGVLSVVGVICFGVALVVTKQKVSVEAAVIMVVFTTLGSAIGGAMSGLPSLLARMSGQAEAPPPPPSNQKVTITNAPDDPVPTVDTEKEDKK